MFVPLLFVVVQHFLQSIQCSTEMNSSSNLLDFDSMLPGSFSFQTKLACGGTIIVLSLMVTCLLNKLVGKQYAQVIAIQQDLYRLHTTCLLKERERERRLKT